MSEIKRAYKRLMEANDELRDEVDRLKHQRHSRVWRSKPGYWVTRWAYRLGIIAASGYSWNRYCDGCLTYLRWDGRRCYILGASRDTWRCWLVGHHRRGDALGFGLCGKCCPCPDCGSVSVPCECRWS